MNDMSHIKTREAIRTRFSWTTGKITATREKVQYEAAAQRKTISFNFGISYDENHEAAAQALLDETNHGTVIAVDALIFKGDYYWACKHISIDKQP